MGDRRQSSSIQFQQLMVKMNLGTFVVPVSQQQPNLSPTTTLTWILWK